MNSYLWRLLIAGALLLSMSCHALAVEVKTENGVEYHESGNNKIVFTLLEDVLYLLPEDIMDSLRPVLFQIMSNSDFGVEDEYWKKRKISKAEFIQSYADIQKKPDLDGYRLGRSVRDIIEIALRPANDDMMNTQWQKNVAKFLRSAKDNNYVIKYEGYQDQTLEKLADDLYKLNAYDKENIYPQLVVITTNIWVSTLKKNSVIGNNKVSFVRRPPLIISEGSIYAMLDQMRRYRMIQDQREQQNLWTNQYYESLNRRNSVRQPAQTTNPTIVYTVTQGNQSTYSSTPATTTSQNQSIINAQKEISNIAKEVLKSGQ